MADALDGRVEKTAKQRMQKIEFRQLSTQAEECRNIVNRWDCTKSRCVQRIPTQHELENKTLSYEQVSATDGAPQRKSLIFSAIRSGSMEALTRLLDEFGPCLTLRDDVNFNTALHMAAVKTQNSGPMVQLLVARGHMSNARNRYGWTALEFARQVGNKEALEIFDNKEDAERFSLDIGKETGKEKVNEDVADKIVLDAVRSGQKDLIHHFLPKFPNAGSVLDAGTGNTTLHYQVLVDDDPDIVLMLLARGGDANLRNAQGRTALNLAETKKRDKTTEVLVRWLNAGEEEHQEMLHDLENKLMGADGDSPLRTASPLQRGGSPFRGSPLRRGAQGSEGEAEEDGHFEEDGPVDLDQFVPEEPRPASRGSSRGGTSIPQTGKSRPWKMDIDDLLEEPLGFADAGAASEMLHQMTKELHDLRAKVGELELRQETLLASPTQVGSPGGDGYQTQQFLANSHTLTGGGVSTAVLPRAKDSVHQAAKYGNDFSRPTTGDTMGAANIEELFYKMHLMQKKIDRHEMALEQQSQVMTEQQETAIYQINAKMEEITVQQQHAAQMLAETSHKIGSYLQFDKTGAPSQDGKIVLTVRAAHGLLHLDPSHPPSPYGIIAIDQQVMMTAVAPDTRNPIWEKECVFDVPSKPSRITVSILDRTILGANRTVLLGKTYLSLNLLTDTDMEEWHDLTTDEFGMVRQHAGSVRVRRRFVPANLWAEYLKERAYQASLVSIPDPLVESQGRGPDANIYGLYIMVLKGEGISSGLPLQNVMAYFQMDQGTNRAESTKHPLRTEMSFGKSEDEIQWRDVDARQKLKIYLAYEMDGNIERAAYVSLKVDGFPFDEVYEDWHPMEVTPGMGKMEPRVRLAVYRTKFHPHDQPITCTFCGATLQHQFQAPHLSVFCPKYVISCPHSRIGCDWSGARLEAQKHLQTCTFESLRESIYATSIQISGIQDLLVQEGKKGETTNQGMSNTAIMSAQTPKLAKMLKGHKRPVKALAGCASSRKLVSGDESGVIKVWDIAYDEEMDHIQGHRGEVCCMHYNAEFPSKMMSGGAYPDDTIKIWDTSDLHCDKTMLGGGQNFAVNGLCAMRYGIGENEVCRLYSVDDSAVLRDWDVETGQNIASMPAHELGIKCCTARDGTVMTGSLDMSVKVWDASTFDCIATLDCVGDSVMGLEIIAGAWLLAAGTNSVKIWDMRSRRLYRVLDGCRWPILNVDSFMYCTTYDVPQNIQVWDISNPDPRHWKVLDFLIGHQSDVTDLVWFQQSLCSSSFDRTIGIWQPPQGR